MTAVNTATRTVAESVSDGKVIDISWARLDEAAEVLARAFVDYPVSRYIFPDHGAAERHLPEVFRFMCGARLANGDPVKGIVRNGRLVGVASLDGPEQKPWPEPMEHAFADFAERAGDGVSERFEQYAELTAEHRPAEPHFYLIILGVLPEAQGQGYGRALLDEVQAMSAAHPVSQGVALDTETTANVSLYEHCGYRVTAQSRLDDVPIWCMFRPDDAHRAVR